MQGTAPSGCDGAADVESPVSNGTVPEVGGEHKAIEVAKAGRPKHGFAVVQTLAATLPTVASTVPQEGAEPVVFISHAGPEKQFFADIIYTTLVCRGVDEALVFLDEHSMRIGQWQQQLLSALDSTRIGIFVLSEEFVTRKWPMLELHILLERVDRGDPVVLVPVCYGLTVEQCGHEALQTLYDSHDWGQKERPKPDQIQTWIDDISRLVKFEARSLHQSRRYHGTFAMDVAKWVFSWLQDKGFATVAGGRVLHSFLRRVTEQLLGREELVERVKAELIRKRAVFLHGGPGEGKTSVASEAACQLEEKGQFNAGTFLVNIQGLQVDYGQLPVDHVQARKIAKDAVKAHIAAAMYQQLMECKGDVNATRDQLTWQEQWTQLLAWLRRLKEKARTALMAVENAEDAMPVSASEELAAVLEELRQYQGVAVLVTSRQHTYLYPKFAVLEVEPLDPKSAGDLVSSGIEMDVTQAQLMARYCGRNALMLEALASFLRYRPEKLQDIVSAAHKRRPLPEDTNKFRTEHVEQLKLWLLDFLDPDSITCLARLSVFPDNFSDDGVAAVALPASNGVNSTSRDALLDRLRDLSILRRLPDPPVAAPGGARYTMHAMHREAAQKLLTPEATPQANRSFAYFVVSLADVLREHRPEKGAAVLLPLLALLSSEQQNFRKLSDLLNVDNTPSWATKLGKLADELKTRNMLVEAAPLYERALVIREEVLGPKHPDTATSLNNLANLISDQGDYGKAAPLYESVLAIREEVLGPKHPDTAASLDNLANLYADQGEYGKAAPLYERALAIRDEVLGPKHPHTATSLNNLASLLSEQGDNGKAAPLYERALAIREEVLGPRHPDTATSLNNLAMLYADQGDYGKAAPLFKRALAIWEEVLGPKHPDTAASLNNLAILYKALGDYGKAAPLYESALAIREEVLGPKHSDTAKSLGNLANLYADQGDYGKAAPLYERALAIMEEVLGPKHPDTAKSLINLANLYEAQGADGKAAPLCERALAIMEEVLGPKHPDTAKSLINLANLYKAQGEHRKAASLYERALAVREDAL